MAGKILLIDGFSLLYRAFFALPLMDNGEGAYTNAIYGFMSMLLKAIDSEKPDYCAVAFDVDKHTFRHEAYSEYKAGRAETPEEMLAQIDTAKQLLEMCGIPILQVQGYEADDILGTVSLICEENGTDCVIVTGDRDSYQLAGTHTGILLTKKGITETEKVTPEWIHEKYGLTPAQMIDLKSLMGDSSDNIPGIKGIGEKTALKLMGEFGSLDKLLENADAQLKGAVREKVLAGRDSARMSRFLAEINRHVPMEFSFEACRLGSFENAKPLLRKLKLRSIIEKIGAGDKAAAAEAAPLQEAPAQAEKHIENITADGLKNAIDALLEGAGTVALHMGAGFSFANDRGEGIVCDIGGDLLTPGLTAEDITKALESVYAAASVRVIFWNMKGFEGSVNEFHARAEDVQLAAYAINPQAPLKTPEDVCAIFDISPCGCVALDLIDIWARAEKRMDADGVMKLYREVELPLAFVLRDMQDAGFRVDSAYLEKLGGIYNGRIAELTQKIYEAAGRSVNLNSPKQLSQLLFEEMGLPKQGSKGSTNAEVLEALADEYPICALILEYRKYQKLNSTYVQGLTQQISADGRIHTVFEQAVTGTGRISSREPNLQNIPVRTELGREIRRAFIPAEGCVLIDADYSQIELRILAHMSGDPAMRDAFIKGQDIHARTASEIFGVPLGEVTHEMRSDAKAVNFGIVYGISEFGLAKNTGVSNKRAGQYIETYFKRYPGIRRFMDEQVSMGKTQGYVTTMLGRRRYLPELKSPVYNMRQFGERAAMNSPIQGTAADVIKLAMVSVARELKARGLKTRLIMQVHDELIMEAPLGEEQAARELLVNCMQNIMELTVPLTAEVSSGGDWNECKP